MQTYKQLQEIRLYYDFNSVDVDRYHFDDKYSEVAVAARELPPSQLPARARTWVNMHLLYTHGYGVVMSPVNNFTPDGMPEFIMQDIPPRTSPKLKITRPEIYYGKETDSFAIVHSRTKEFDYPKGNQNAYTSYEGDGRGAALQLLPAPGLRHRPLGRQHAFLELRHRPEPADAPPR